MAVKLADDAGNAGHALQAAKKLVEQDHVMAIVGEFSNQDAAFQKYVEQKAVPVVGGQPYTAPMSSSPMFFPTGGTLVPALGYGLGAAAKDAGKRTYGVLYCAEAPVCATFSAPFAKSLATAVGGMKLAYSAVVAANAPTYTSQCLAARQAGVDALFIGTSPAVVNRVLDSCAQQNYTPAQFNTGGDVNPDVVKNPNAAGMTVVQYNLPYVDTTTDGGKLFHKIVDQYAPQIKSSSAFGDALMQVFAGFELFRLVGDDSKLTPSATPSDVLAGLYAVKDATLGGIAPKLQYVKGKPTQVACWFEEVIKGRQLTVPTTTPQCVPADKRDALYTAFGVPH